MTETAVKFSDVRYCYNEVCAVHDVSFDIEKGQLTALVGPNGGGKSTIIKLMSGFVRADEGKIAINSGSTIGYVAQNFGFDVSFPITVLEVVLSGALDKKIKPFRKYTKEQVKRAEDAIEEVGLAGFEKRGINQLSGGQLKRVIIARALASEADILVLDEPDSNLDAEAAKELYMLLNDLKKIKTIVVASHHIDYILDIADTAIYVNRKTQNFEKPKQLKDKLKEGMVI
ncbi:MAG: ATP-binding cassette domain-containing protein [Eubacteriales bacterium]